jgi:hypothetical protein
MEKSYMKKLLVIGVLFLFLGASATIAAGERAWADNFDAYTNGQLLDGTSDDGGWEGWGNDPQWYGTVTNEQARSSPHSVKIEVNSDLVHQYSDYTSGKWVYTAWQYIPEDFAGETYFMLFCGYDGGGSGTIWCVQLHMRSEDDTVVSDFNLESAPVVYGEWTEIRCEIDLDQDWLEIYYDDVFLAEHAWTDTVQGTGGGTLNIAAVDLFANGASPVYYDDISLLPYGQTELLCDAGGPYSGEIDEEIQFIGFATGGTEPYTWEWDFGDGETSTEQNPTHAYTEAGEYTATLTVTDAAEATATDTADVTIVEPQPVLEIGAITGGFGIAASVKNTGDGPATTVDWTIALDGKLIFIGKSSSGSIATLAVAGEEAIKSSLILGIGKTNIVVSATCAEGKTAEATASAFVLGPFVLGVK